MMSPPVPHLAAAAAAVLSVLEAAHIPACIDIALAAFAFEVDAIETASPWHIAPGVVVRTCSAEHLVVYKLVAARPQDLVDMAGIVRRQGARLNVEFVRRWGRESAELEEDPDLLRPFEDAVRSADRS
jgi:hypothetical protein